MHLPDMSEHEKTIRSIEDLARLMDSQFKLPGTEFKLGLDTLIGLIPGIGDTIGMGVSGYIIFQSAKLGVPKHKTAHMLFNSGIDWLIGIIPFVGDLFDWGWKANNKNAAILRDHFGPPAANPMRDVTPVEPL